MKKPITSPKSGKNETDIILITVSGISPAIITETIWALAFQMDKPIVPSRIITITTKRGREKICDELFTPPKGAKTPIWDSLCATLSKKGIRTEGKLRFGTTGDDIRVMTKFNKKTGKSEEIEDIRTVEDNESAADFILRHLMPFAEEPTEKIIASIAGGRKTMGALLYACMSMIGRETDEITHVLVNEPYDSGMLSPKFYFPEQEPQKLRAYDGKIYNAKDAKIEIATIPFVPLRNRFIELGDKPASFARLMARYTKGIITQDYIARIAIDKTNQTIKVDGKEVKLRKRAFDLMRFLIAINESGEIPVGQPEAVEPLKKFLGENSQWVNDEDDIKRELSEIRRRLKEQRIMWLPGMRSNSLRLPPFKVVS